MEVAINGDERFVLTGCKCQQLAILLAGPAGFLHSYHLVCDQLLPEPLIDALIE